MADLDLRYNLKNILRERGMSQLELAKEIHISPTNLNTRLARGRNCQLSLLESICKALDVDMKMLMYGDNTQAPTIEEDNVYRKKYEDKCEEVIELQHRIIELTSKKYTQTKKQTG
jgi:DNA-binding Xre family transcriptional regulator